MDDKSKRRGVPVAWPKVNGVGRVIGSEQCLEIYFDSEPTDDQMRAIHDVLRQPPQPTEPTDEVAAMDAVMESIDPATWPGLTSAQRCALGRFAKPQPAEPQELDANAGMDEWLSQPVEPVKDKFTALGDWFRVYSAEVPEGEWCEFSTHIKFCEKIIFIRNSQLSLGVPNTADQLSKTRYGTPKKV